ncbi:MAG: efflux RND transporter periplasmic adaptor subunit [Paracoccaceae bacterium]
MKTALSWTAQFLIVAALGFAAFVFITKNADDSTASFDSTEIAEATLNLPVATLTPQSVTPQYVSLAKVEEWQSSTLGSQATGRVVWTCDCFEEGQMVTAGTRLLQIDATSYERDLVDREKDLGNTEADLIVAEIETVQARENYARLDLGEPNDIVLKIPELNAAKLAVLSSRAALTIAQKNLDETNIVAPFTGIISQVGALYGDLIGNGANLGTLVGTDVFRVRFPILENQLSLAQVGEDIAIETSTEPVITKTGIIKAIDIDIDQDTRLNSVIVSVQAPLDGAVLRLGRFVNGTFIGQPLSNVFAIPLIALDNESQYYQIGPDNRLIPVSAIALYRDFESVYVDAGDRANIQIVTGNAIGLREGMLVQGYEE